jgi:hypothetical protein
LKISKKAVSIFSVLILLIVLYGLTYLPRNMISIDPDKVSTITIFNGGTGKSIEITSDPELAYIMNNLNDVTFQKGKLSLGYMGFSFRLTINNGKGKMIKELIVNSEDTIRYKGFFYRATKNEIDYNYLLSLYEK